MDDMSTQFRCKNENRRDAVRMTKDPGGSFILNGIDYLEVASPDQQKLEVHFIHDLPGEAGAVPPAPAPALTEKNFRISGGVRITGVRVKTAAAAGKVLTLTVDRAGDFSTYRLHLLASPDSETPPPGFDAQLAEVDFSFKVECPSDFDCAETGDCPPEKPLEPLIDYLAKDYNSFRRLMLDRMATVMPDWRERNPSDLGIALVESIAYVADRLSYYQDAVATEAYLGTARQRISVRRHARLLDYAMHDGCNARTWVQFEVVPAGGVDGLTLPQGTPVLTRGPEETTLVEPAELDKVLREEAPIVFETMHDLTLDSAHNRISLYTWDDTECCLPRGATRATISNEPPVSLVPGHLLLLEEVKGTVTGLAPDADPAHRHVVRLTGVVSETESGDPLVDPLNDHPVAEISWAVEDALPFPVCISTRIDTPTGKQLVLDVSVARGNIALADHGLSIGPELLGQVPADSAGRLVRPRLSRSPLTQQGRARDRFGEPVRDAQNDMLPFDPKGSAAAAMRWNLSDTLPCARLVEDGDLSRPWGAHRDLLASHRFDNHFTVEVDHEARAFLRFGDGIHGARPKSTASFEAYYRVGSGRAGNVGANALTRVVFGTAGFKQVRNPLAAVGGTDPEPMDQVRMYAPQAFRTQERAVTLSDYAEAAERHPEVQKAAASLRWTGSWYTVFVTVDRKGGRPVDSAFETEMRRFLERFRLAGQDLEIDAPRFVPLDIAFTVCVKPGYFRSQVKEELLRMFSSRDLPNGQRGFFHPDNFTFGQNLYLSRMIAMIMDVPGVQWVDAEDKPPKPNRFRCWGNPAQGEFDAGKMTFGRLEIARLDNDPSVPENGKLDFIMEGGL